MNIDLGLLKIQKRIKEASDTKKTEYEDQYRLVQELGRRDSLMGGYPSYWGKGSNNVSDVWDNRYIDMTLENTIRMATDRIISFLFPAGKNWFTSTLALPDTIDDDEFNRIKANQHLLSLIFRGTMNGSVYNALIPAVKDMLSFGFGVIKIDKSSDKNKNIPFEFINVPALQTSYSLNQEGKPTAFYRTITLDPHSIYVGYPKAREFIKYEEVKNKDKNSSEIDNQNRTIYVKEDIEIYCYYDPKKNKWEEITIFNNKIIEHLEHTHNPYIFLKDDNQMGVIYNYSVAMSCLTEARILNNLKYLMYRNAEFNTHPIFNKNDPSINVEANLKLEPGQILNWDEKALTKLEIGGTPDVQEVLLLLNELKESIHSKFKLPYTKTGGVQPESATEISSQENELAMSLLKSSLIIKEMFVAPFINRCTEILDEVFDTLSEAKIERTYSLNDALTKMANTDNINNIIESLSAVSKIMTLDPTVGIGLDLDNILYQLTLSSNLSTSDLKNPSDFKNKKEQIQQQMQQPQQPSPPTSAPNNQQQQPMITPPSQQGGQ